MHATASSKAYTPGDLDRWERERALDDRMADRGYVESWQHVTKHGSGDLLGSASDDSASGLWDRARGGGSERRQAAAELARRTQMSSSDAKLVLDHSLTMADLRGHSLGSAALEIAKIYRPGQE